MSRLRFAVATTATSTHATVTLDGVSMTVAVPDGYTPSAGDVLWLGQDGRRLTLLGYKVTA